MTRISSFLQGSGAPRDRVAERLDQSRPARSRRPTRTRELRRRSAQELLGRRGPHLDRGGLRSLPRDGAKRRRARRRPHPRATHRRPDDAQPERDAVRLDRRAWFRVRLSEHLVIVFMINQLPNRTGIAGKCRLTFLPPPGTTPRTPSPRLSALAPAD